MQNDCLKKIRYISDLVPHIAVAQIGFFLGQKDLNVAKKYDMGRTWSHSPEV